MTHALDLRTDKITLRSNTRMTISGLKKVQNEEAWLIAPMLVSLATHGRLLPQVGESFLFAWVHSLLGEYIHTAASLHRPPLHSRRFAIAP